MNFFGPLSIGFVIGGIFTSVFFVSPLSNLNEKLADQVIKFTELNIKEQERIESMKNISQAEIIRWVSMNEKQSREYQEIYNTLHEIEKQYSNPGSYWLTLITVLTAAVVAFFIWLQKLEDTKDLATMNNFRTFVTQRLEGSTNQTQLPPPS